MHRPITAMLWEVWGRHRWVLAVSPVYFLALSILSHAVSDGLIYGLDLSVYKDAIFFVLLFLASPLVVGLIPLFAYACDADIAGRESTFPARMLTLPLTTRALVGWPMICGTVAIALTWLAVASLVLRPAGMDVPLWWPAVFSASCLAWIQAMAWRPFGLPGMRILAAWGPIGGLVAVLGLGWGVRLPEVVASLLLAGTILPAFVVAVVGLSRARRGDVPDWQWLATWVQRVAGWFTCRGRPFATASRAQVWFEWRRNGLGLSIFVVLAILFLGALILVNRHNPRLPAGSPFRSPILLLVVPLLGAMMAGNGWGNCGDPGRGLAMRAFLATRPISGGGLIWAKMKAAAIGTAVAWGATLAAVVLMLLLTRSWAELAGPWNLVTGNLPAAQTAALVILGVALLLGGTWKSMFGNLFLGLAGRDRVMMVAASVFVFAMAATVPLGYFVLMHPQYHADLWSALPWLLAEVAVLKLALAGWALRAIRRQGLVDGPLLKRLLLGWLLAAAGLLLLLGWLLPAEIAPWYLLLPCVVLALPLLRISLAPLALAWNRHR